MFGINIKPVHALIIAISALTAEPLLSEEKCDVLGSLQADPMAVEEPVDFFNIGEFKSARKAVKKPHNAGCLELVVSRQYSQR